MASFGNSLFPLCNKLAPMPAERILIVDDDRDVRESMGEYLQGHGYEVTLAEGGEALRRALAARWAPRARDAFCAFNDVHAMLAFVGAALLRELPQVSHRLGGSHAQRGLIGLTLRQAQQKIGVRARFFLLPAEIGL